jgi:hypothetical protein
MNKIDEYAAFIPLVYLVVTAAIAMIGHWLKVPDVLLGTIIGAGLMRVKISAKPKLN